MDRVLCLSCGHDLSAEYASTPQPPCPSCGESQRVFYRIVSDSLSLADGHRWGHAREGKPIGFGESGCPSMARGAHLDAAGHIILDLAGAAPHNEEDTELVGRILAAAMGRSTAHPWSYERPAHIGDDGMLLNRATGRTVYLQVVQVLPYPLFYTELSKLGAISGLRLTPEETADSIQAAIIHKERIPAKQRGDTVLALAAYRLPALTLGPAIGAFRKAYGTCGTGFHSVWIVGPDQDFACRLDQNAGHE